MKIISRALVVLLAVTSVVLLKICILCLFTPGDAATFFNTGPVPAELNILLLMLGSFVLVLIALQVMSLVWVLQNRKEGYALAFLISGVTIVRGALVLVLGGSETSLRLSVVPMVIGFVIFMLALTGSRKLDSETTGT